MSSSILVTLVPLYSSPGDLSQLLNFSGVPGKVAAHFNARKLVLIAFGDVHRDVNTFLSGVRLTWVESMLKRA